MSLEEKNEQADKYPFIDIQILSVHENNCEDKPSEAAESKLSISVIPVEESKEEEKTLMLSSALAELVVDSEEDKQISGNGKGSKRKRWKKSESLIPIDETKREVTIDKKKGNAIIKLKGFKLIKSWSMKKMTVKQKIR